jgi:hypothetical protein
MESVRLNRDALHRVRHFGKAIETLHDERAHLEHSEGIDGVESRHDVLVYALKDGGAGQAGALLEEATPGDVILPLRLLPVPGAQRGGEVVYDRV